MLLERVGGGGLGCVDAVGLFEIGQIHRYLHRAIKIGNLFLIGINNRAVISLAGRNACGLVAAKGFLSGGQLQHVRWGLFPGRLQGHK